MKYTVSPDMYRFLQIHVLLNEKPALKVLRTFERTGCGTINWQKYDRKFRVGVYMELTNVKCEKKDNFIIYKQYTQFLLQCKQRQNLTRSIRNGQDSVLSLNKPLQKTVTVFDSLVFWQCKTADCCEFDVCAF